MITLIIDFTNSYCTHMTVVQQTKPETAVDGQCRKRTTIIIRTAGAQNDKLACII